ncbi:capsular biosynthesis protein [Zavarzinia compransoris]|uniref:capsule biosynthesis protein n=1 Tax=Zavarzinia marina TaxID=2911065 RepID=UPI001F1DCD2C|nr:capsular biosynthesis protein [Zavarzinia marina]MCF4166415.1 capsular biosynthesis protein [Zavarzinia marina]
MVSPAPPDLPATPRSFLFLQGPLGPFFRRLGRRLRGRGHRVLRVNFNGGDLYDWPCRGVVNYRGTADDWPGFVTDLAARNEVTDIVLIGDCRPLHVAAVEALRAWRPSIRVHVFEEGYIRPDWITLEADGVNARSNLPRDPAVIAAVPEGNLPPRFGVPVGQSTFRMGLRAMISYFAMFLLTPLFRHYVHHRPDMPSREARLWFRRLLGREARKTRALAQEEELLASGRPYFLLLLQLNVDKQIVNHSPYKSMRDYMAAVMRSFADHAPADAHLVVKAHPLDNGRDDHGGDLAALAAETGLDGRVMLIDGGNLFALLGGCRAAVTVNSTAGISALHRSVPLIALGNAIFNIAGLCHQGGLDSFWTEPSPVDAGLYHAWRNMVAYRTQVNGNFYVERGIWIAIEGSLPILEGAPEAA